MMGYPLGSIECASTKKVSFLTFPNFTLSSYFSFVSSFSSLSNGS